MQQIEFPFLEPVSAPLTLQDAINFYQDANSDHPRRGQIRSAFRTVARGLQLPPDQVPADAERLRELLKSGTAANARVKPSAWKVSRSQALCALRDAGADIRPSRDDTRISAVWQRLLDRVTDRKAVIGLARFLRFLTRMGITPEHLAQSHFDAYLDELLTKSLRAKPETSYRQMVRLWKACAATVPGWPAVEVADVRNPRHFALPWEGFPESFRQDVEAFLSVRLDPDPLVGDEIARVRPDTDRGRRKTLRSLASALVLSGETTSSEVISLSVLTEPGNVRFALAYLRDQRFGGEYRPHLLAHADLARIIAKHWEKSPSKAEELATLTRSLKMRMPIARGMTPTNRRRLTQFDDPVIVKTLLQLPQRTLRSVSGGQRTHLSAVRLMYALQVAILLVVPLRSKNLTELKLGQNIIVSGKGKTRQMRLFLSRDETKTYTDFSATLPARLYSLFDVWLETWRPIVCDQPSPYLFPNASGALRSREALAQKICRFVQRETGLEMHLHLFRHLSAKLYLSRNPDGIETVRQLLGHKTIKTTLKAYAELQTDPAFRRLEEALLDIYERPGQRGRWSR